MKGYYEGRYRIKLPMRIPVILRIDGKSFHTWTKKESIQKPFSPKLMKIFNQTARELMKRIQGSVFAYLQSDEINILIHNYKRLDSQAWFDNNLQKIVSVSVSMATAWFNLYFGTHPENPAYFDGRVFVIPESEVCNYFIWRQKDWLRNSLQMYARSLYTQKSLEGKNNSEIHELIHQKGKNWAKLPDHYKNGRAIYKDERDIIVDTHIPIFTKRREYIQNHLDIESE